MTMSRITGSQLHAARVLVSLSREDLAERAGLCRYSIRKWEMSSHAIPGAILFAPVPCRLTCLSASAERFSGAG